MEPLPTIDEPLIIGTVVDRPNRFVVRVRFDDSPERVFLCDPGVLESMFEQAGKSGVRRSMIRIG